MKQITTYVAAGIVLLVAGCAQAPHPMMNTYIDAVGIDAAARAGSPPRVGERRLEAALLIHAIAPASGPEARPLPDPALDRLAARVSGRLERDAGVRIHPITTARSATPEEGVEAFKRLVSSATSDLVIAVLLNGLEVRVPATLDLGVEAVPVRGTRTEHYALAEVVVLDPATQTVLARAEGRASSTLDELDGALRSNRHPAIYSSTGQARIYPEPEHAREVLRAVTADEAAAQALARLDHAWRG